MAGRIKPILGFAVTITALHVVNLARECVGGDRDGGSCWWCAR